MDKEDEVVHVQGLPCRTWQGVAGGGEVEQGGERRRPASCSDALGDLSMGRLLVIHPEDVLCSRLHPIHTLEHHQAIPSHINTSTAPQHQQSSGAAYSLDTRPPEVSENSRSREFSIPGILDESQLHFFLLDYEK